MRNRDTALSQLRAQSPSPAVLIVGGGINGIGVYRDLALQGIPAVLVEKGDFSSGTSAAPSRLIHGGLRYLETGEFALVRESVVERNHLLINAPHLVRPLPVWVPAFSWFGGLLSAGLRFLKLKKTPGAKGILAVKLGLVFFDRFGRGNQTMPDHRLVPAEERRRRMPNLSPKVAAVAEYYDARLTHPERLALELVEDAERDCPDAIALPYVSLDGIDGGTVRLRDEISGETLTVTPTLVVNCAGAWADRVNARLGIDKRLIGGTKGSHLVLRRPDLARPLGNGMLYFETRDFRACLIYTLDEERVLVGTTDIRADDPDTVRCSDEEIAYLFDVLEQVLPGANAKKEDIVFAYAGLRPLPFSDASTTGAISRDHALRDFEPEGARPFPVMTLVGGKWTTYRACAAQIADAVLSRLGARRKADTLKAPIGGGRDFDPGKQAVATRAKALAEACGLDPATATRLLDRYGSRAASVAEAIRAGGGAALSATSLYARGEIAWIVDNERVTRLSDIVLRRTLMGFEAVATRAVVEEVAAIAAERLGWDGARRARETEETLALLRDRYRVRLD
ncbi:glycerol-3-phosphate dehydrogenase/oxidase [Ensifer soli]|uniref:glycerol-3-phosphate dehydrogenase/oxidase n=1 Tax=Ciceribacter sp. sgz301302 TaxID=3342379 RepID=UPI0035B9D916